MINLAIYLNTFLCNKKYYKAKHFHHAGFSGMRHFISNNAALFDRISKVELKQLEADSLPKIESPGVVWRFFCVKRQILSFSLLFMVFSIIL